MDWVGVIRRGCEIGTECSGEWPLRNEHSDAFAPARFQIQLIVQKLLLFPPIYLTYFISPLKVLFLFLFPN